MYNSEYNSFISRTGNIDLYYSLMNKNIIGCLYTPIIGIYQRISLFALYILIPKKQLKYCVN